MLSATMPDAPTSKPFDISQALRPARAGLPGAGEVRVDIRNVSFLRWFGNGERRRRWDDGPAFLRMLLTDRAALSTEGDAPPIDPAVIEAIDADGLETVALQLLVDAGPVFGSLSRRAGRTGVSTFATDDPATTVRATERLLIGARAYLTDFETGQERMSKQLNEVLGGESITRQMTLLQEANAARRMLNPLGAGIVSNFHQIAKGDVVGSKLLELARSGSFASHGLLASLGVAPNMVGSTLLGQRQWSSINDMLGLGISKSILAATQGLDTSSILSQIDRRAAAMFRPGFQSIAALALGGDVERGAASALLSEYDTFEAGGPVFGSVLAAVAALDDEEAPPADRLALLQSIIAFVSDAMSWAKTEVDKAGLFSILGAVAAILTLYPELNPWHTPEKPSAEVVRATSEIRALRTELHASRLADEHKHIRYLRDCANLRASPDRNGVLLRVVYPDQLVNVHDTRGDWARVTVYDYASDSPIEGWMNRRNLRASPQ